MGKPERDALFGARRTSFGRYAAVYDAVRPEWPAETVAWMLGSPAPEAVCHIVDLGAGTGKGTRAIAALGHEVIAVDPSDGMREALVTALEALPAQVARRISTVAGGAEEIPVETGSIDAVTVFHDDPLLPAAQALRARGRKPQKSAAPLTSSSRSSSCFLRSRPPP
jgi:SAM-dependent methyltransferase